MHGSSFRTLWFNELVGVAVCVAGSTSCENLVFTNARRKIAEAATSGDRFRSKRNSPCLCGHRRIGIPLGHRTSRGVCNRRLRTLLVACERVLGLLGAPDIAAIVPSGACVTVLHERRAERSRFLDVFPNLNFSSGTCSIADTIVFHKPFTEWSNVRLHVRRAAYSPRESPSRGSCP